MLATKDLIQLSANLKKEHRRLVFTTGTFDLIHAGQGRYLAEAKAAGDYLVVGVESNRSYKKRKGSEVVLDQKVRAEMLANLRAVDEVIIVDENKIDRVLRLLRPDIFYTVRDSWYRGGHRHRKDYDLARKLKIKIIRSERYQPYISSSKLVERIAEKKIVDIINPLLSESAGRQVVIDNSPIKITTQVPRNLLSLTFKGEIVEFKELSKVSTLYTHNKQKVVFTAGTFDLIHVGHARYFAKAKSLGDILVVGLPSNESVRRLKGEGRPLLDEVARAETLTYLRSVDYVVIFNEDTILECLRALKPDIFFTVDEPWNNGLRASPEYKLVKSYGGEVVLSPRQSPYLSASLIINKAAGHRVKEIFKECLKVTAKKGSLKEKNIKVDARRTRYQF